MIDKTNQSLTDVMRQIKDGATILIGGFGPAGQPTELIDALIDCNVKNLTIVSNNAKVLRVYVNAGATLADTLYTYVKHIS